MTDWLITTPVWGARYVDVFTGTVLPAINEAIKHTDGKVRFIVHTDQPFELDNALKAFERRILPVPDGADNWKKFAAAHQDAVTEARPCEAIAIINADMVPSREVFAASERRFAEGKRLIMMAASRTLGGTAPIGATSAELLDWTMEYRHPAIQECFWGTGRSVIPWAMYFENGEDIVLRGFHLHPFAVMKDRNIVFNGTVDLDLPDNFALEEVHLITDRDEAAFAEISPPERTFPLLPAPLSTADIAQWARRQTTPLHRWMFEKRIVIKGSGADHGDVAICNEILSLI